MAIAQAVYLGKYEKVDDDKYRALVQITYDDKGQQQEWIEISGNTQDEITRSATREVLKFQTQDTKEDVLKDIPPGTVIPLTLTEPAPILTDDQIWFQKVHLAERAKLLRDFLTLTGLDTKTFDADLVGLAQEILDGYSTERALQL